MLHLCFFTHGCKVVICFSSKVANDTISVELYAANTSCERDRRRERERQRERERCGGRKGGGGLLFHKFYHIKSTLEVGGRGKQNAYDTNAGTTLITFVD